MPLGGSADHVREMTSRVRVAGAHRMRSVSRRGNMHILKYVRTFCSMATQADQLWDA